MPKKNNLKEKLLNGKTVVGTWCEMASPTVANVVANSGLDFLIIDMEHGPMSYETAEQMARSAEAEGCWPIVRTTDDQPANILRALELGGQAVLVPHVESEDQAKQVASATRYFPEGNRGLGPYTRNHNYTHDQLPASLKRTNEETLVGILVEGKEGVSRLDRIADIKGIDLIYLGIYDISQSVGFPGELRNPVVINAIREAATTLRKKGVAAGSYAMDLEYAQLLIECGFQFIAYLNDCAVLRQHFYEARGRILNERH